MIHFVTGPLGAGKSMYAVKQAAKALLQGRVFAGNIRFVEGWEHRILMRAMFYKLAGRRARAEYRLELAERYFYSPDLQTLVNLRLTGRGEGRGVRVIDEAHNAMNNRDWAAKEQKTQLRKMTLARKRGWTDYIIAQHKDNTDAALRRVASVEIRCLDWQQISRVPILGVKLLPFHFFLAQAYARNLVTSGGSSSQSDARRLYSEVYFRGWYAALYDTFEDFDVEDEDDEPAVWLPRRTGAHPGAPPGAEALPGGAVVLAPRRGSYGVKSGDGEAA